jgi:hypothetical protein
LVRAHPELFTKLRRIGLCFSGDLCVIKELTFSYPKIWRGTTDAIAGRRGRNAFLVEAAREVVRRRKLLAFLKR